MLRVLMLLGPRLQETFACRHAQDDGTQRGHFTPGVEDENATSAQLHPVREGRKEALGLAFKNRNELGAILEERGFKVGAELETGKRAAWFV